MEERQIEESVKEVIEDLKNKIDALTIAPEAADDETARKVEAIRNKAIRAFSDASSRLSSLSENILNEEEVAKAVETVKVRSRELYENALSRIDALLSPKSESIEDEQKNPVEEVKQGLDDLIGNVSEEISSFMNREDVKRAVDKTREGVIDAAEKALEILKEWLAPERDDK